jgi:beta-glucosidase-like glycosyl hydrolase
MADLDRALFNSLKQRFDLGLFDPKDAYAWPTADDVGTDASAAMSLMASQESIVLLRNDRQLLPLPKVRKMPGWPRSWANFSLVQLYAYSNAWANLSLLG